MSRGKYKTEQINIVVTPREKKRIKALAAMYQQSLSGYILERCMQANVAVQVDYDAIAGIDTDSVIEGVDSDVEVE